MYIGITAEWNPFHKGHASMISALRSKYGNVPVTAVMSGPFVQRGEPAIFDKWTRARWAVEAGADAVLELPALSALQSADIFAEHAVLMLHTLGADHIAFGVETATAEDLMAAAIWMNTEKASRIFHEALKTKGYGEAVTAAVEAEFPSLAGTLILPNNMLGFRYACAIRKHNLPVKIIAIPRTGGKLLSASAIREDFLERGMTEGMLPVQEKEAEILYARGQCTDYNRYMDACLLNSRLYSEKDLTNSLLFSEGLEHRWYKLIGNADYKEALSQIKSRRYLYSRLMRISAQLLISARDIPSPFKSPPPPSYARLLAVRKGRSQWLKESGIPVITSLKRAENTLPEEARISLSIDNRAEDLFHYFAKNSSFRKARMNYYTSPVLVK